MGQEEEKKKLFTNFNRCPGASSNNYKYGVLVGHVCSKNFAIALGDSTKPSALSNGDKARRWRQVFDSGTNQSVVVT